MPFYVDLAPGQMVMVMLRGVWHMDCHPGRSETEALGLT